MSFRIAIPSYKRPTRLRDCSLSLLHQNGVSDSIIDVFVANEDERVVYAAANPTTNLIVAVPGMAAVRNFMTDYYAEGQHVLFMDDDIHGFISLSPFNFMDFVAQAFQEAIRKDLHLWGIHPVANRYFLKDKISTNLRYIIGCFYGVINRRIYVDLEDGEDKLRTCLYYQIDKGVLRYNGIAPVTRYYKEPGGMQTTRTLERQRASGLILLQRFPLLLHRKDKKDGRIEHRFCDKSRCIRFKPSGMDPCQT